MNVRQTVIQSPKIIVKIKRLPSKTKKVVYDMELAEAKKAMNFVNPARQKLIKADGFDYAEIQGIINQLVAPDKYGEYTPKTKSILVYENSELEDVSTFSPDKNNVLQSYQFSLSKSDVNGSFSLAFAPEYVAADGSRINIYDSLRILDVVEIYECKRESDNFNSDYRAMINDKDTLVSHWTKTEEVPVFVGIIKNKKFVAQVTDGGIIRRINVSGVSVAGLVSQFYLNFDTTAMSITKQFVSNEAISKELTCNIAGIDKPVSEIVKKIWEEFCNVAEQGGENGAQGKLGTIAIKYLIEQTMGADFFDFDTSVFHYPLANVMRGEQTQDFYSLINGIIPEPVYEKYAYMDFLAQKMKIKIRKVPFNKTSDKCENNSLGKAINWSSIYNRKLYANEVKSVDIAQSDKEVYTVFFSYLNGYPINSDKLMRIIAAEDNKKSPMIKIDDDKYQIYGYRPLIATFNGFSKSDSESADVEKNLAAVNEQLKGWFGRLDEMLSGSITLAMTYSDDKPIMPGEVVEFLGGQFYVEGISHSWTYGQGDDINLSVSRGGEYYMGEFSPLTDFTKNMKLLENKRSS